MARAHTTSLGRRVLAPMSLAAMLSLVGCEKPIFTDDEPRSQFDQLDKVRKTREPSYLPDEYGNLKPNLTGRLSGLR